MEGSSRIRSSQLPFGNLQEIRFVWVVVVGLQVAEHRGPGIRSIVGNGDRLRISQFHEGLHVEAIVRLCAVALRRRDVCAVGKRLACKHADTGVVSALGEVVTHLEAVLPSAEITCGASGEIVRKGEEYLCAEGLQQDPPGFTW